MKPVIILFVVLCLIDATLAKKRSKKNVKKLDFLFGRIPPGYFEYPALNGYYSPKEAAKVCESDTACGGFTFKGVINSGSGLKKCCDRRPGIGRQQRGGGSG